ncbi:hypothetical protein GRI40_02260 [Altererythrobacter aerius]|uniref:Phage holin family protein n=1 Tax=Tsuneonella aeria TaxID=1837929 RepID=A0A6I4TBA7_9SPHN|nr:hypothetical protein [Tsuneonella aeria]
MSSLLSDGRTYLEAELQYQKSRAAFAADRGKSGAIYGVAGAALLHLALVALVLGSILALTPKVGAFAATAIVVAVLLVAGILLALAARKRFAAISSAFREGAV